jgi:hypothetical protein
MVRCCVWSRNLVNEETLAHWGLLCQKKKKDLSNTEFYETFRTLKPSGFDSWLLPCDILTACRLRSLLLTAPAGCDSCLRHGLINYKMMNERKFNDLPHLSLSQSRVDPRPMTTVGHANTNNAFAVFPENISNEHPIIACWPSKLMK